MKALRRILLMADALFLFAGGLLGPIYALFVKEVGGDLLEASTTFALFMLTAGFVIFFLSFIEDKSRHQNFFVIAGYGLGVIGYVGYFFVTSTIGLFIVQAILGLSIALKDPAYDAMFSRSSEKHLALSWGEWEAMEYMVLGISAIVGGYIAQEFGFQGLFLVMSTFSIVSFLISLYLIKPKSI